MDIIKRLFSYIAARDKRIKFIIVGALNTLIGYGINALMLLLVFDLPLSAKAQLVQITIASFTGHFAGMINGYFCNKYFTFRQRRASLTEFMRFMLVSLVQLLISIILQKAIQDILSLSIYAAMLITIIITTVFGYLGHNYFTFAKKPAAKDAGNITDKEQG